MNPKPVLAQVGTVSVAEVVREVRLQAGSTPHTRKGRLLRDRLASLRSGETLILWEGRLPAGVLVVFPPLRHLKTLSGAIGKALGADAKDKRRAS